MMLPQLILDEDSKHLGIPRQQLSHLLFEVSQAAHLFETEHEARYALGGLGLSGHVAQLDIVQMCLRSQGAVPESQFLGDEGGAVGWC